MEYFTYIKAYFNRIVIDRENLPFQDMGKYKMQVFNSNKSTSMLNFKLILQCYRFKRQKLKANQCKSNKNKMQNQYLFNVYRNRVIIIDPLNKQINRQTTKVKQQRTIAKLFCKSVNTFLEAYCIMKYFCRKVREIKYRFYEIFNI
ncbi:hypothetical protein TTHERM_000011438 (macronuclear) [Tetrahymena thermophila SB210]|uniref:Uncharacterized protein n=1 Tax=Tetrahymena thermophila (strain SB210) TaxID=312017 RepID=W7XGY8_TETTS|nr:hypothetical protein TTHERM_000011438 [Tetrahymena thermophila SB210]EWS76333.1 hypothetical protein TTHERM_000011438 [Tetrahymena thermophila SB210]|eukprot:XP_012651117.1 hypothetical protein TTHERM_000011438 [Tetrahymena thermophila SB210]